jgi:hypothetical protein
MLIAGTTTVTTMIDTSQIENSLIIGTDFQKYEPRKYSGGNRKLRGQTRCKHVVTIDDPKESFWVPGTDLNVQIDSVVKKYTSGELLAINFARSHRKPGKWLVYVVIEVQKTKVVEPISATTNIIKIDTSMINTSSITGTEIEQCQPYQYTGSNKSLEGQIRRIDKITVFDPKESFWVPGTDLEIQIGSEIKDAFKAEHVLSVEFARSIRTPGKWLVDVTAEVPTIAKG